MEVCAVSDPIKINLNNQYYLIDDGDGFFVPEINTDDYLTDMSGKRVTEDDPGLRKMMLKLGIKTFETINVRPFVTYVQTLMGSADDLKNRPDSHLVEKRIRSVVQSARKADVPFGTESALATKLAGLLPEKKAYLLYFVLGEEHARFGEGGYWGSITLAHEMASESGVDITDRSNEILKVGFTNTFNNRTNPVFTEGSGLGDQRYEILHTNLRMANSCSKSLGVDGEPLFTEEEQAVMLGKVVTTRRAFYRKDIEDFFHLAEYMTRERPKQWLMKVEGALMMIADLANAKIPGSTENVFGDRVQAEILTKCRNFQREAFKVIVNIHVRQAIKQKTDKEGDWLAAMDVELNKATGYVQAVAVGVGEEVFPQKSQLEALREIEKIRRGAYLGEIERCRSEALRLIQSGEGEGNRQKAKHLILIALRLVDAESKVGINQDVFSAEERERLKTRLNPALFLGE